MVHRKGTDNQNADALSRLAPLNSSVNLVSSRKRVRFNLRPHFRSARFSATRLHKRYRSFLKTSFVSPPKLHSILKPPSFVNSISSSLEPYVPIDIIDLVC